MKVKARNHNRGDAQHKYKQRGLDHRLSPPMSSSPATQPESERKSGGRRREPVEEQFLADLPTFATLALSLRNRFVRRATKRSNRSAPRRPSTRFRVLLVLPFPGLLVAGAAIRVHRYAEVSSALPVAPPFAGGTSDGVDCPGAVGVGFAADFPAMPPIAGNAYGSMVLAVMALRTSNTAGVGISWGSFGLMCSSKKAS